jgi:hypothetical protein
MEDQLDLFEPILLRSFRLRIRLIIGRFRTLILRNLFLFCRRNIILRKRIRNRKDLRDRFILLGRLLRFTL